MKLFENTQIGASPEGTRKARITVKIDSTVIAGSFTFISNSMNAASDVQIDRSFDDDLLVTGFGQKVTNLQLAGVSLEDSNVDVCKNANETLANATGVGTLPELYLKYHAGKRAGQSKVPIVKVVYAGVVFEGFLIGLTQSPYTISDGRNLDVLQYTLTIAGSLKESASNLLAGLPPNLGNTV